MKGSDVNRFPSDSDRGRTRHAVTSTDRLFAFLVALHLGVLIKNTLILVVFSCRVWCDWTSAERFVFLIIEVVGEYNQLHIKTKFETWFWFFLTYHLSTKFSHSDTTATQTTATPARLLKKYVKGKTSRKAALGSPIWVTISHRFW